MNYTDIYTQIDTEYDLINCDRFLDIEADLSTALCKEATETLLEAYETRNAYLIEQNTELIAKLTSTNKPRDND